MDPINSGLGGARFPLSATRGHVIPLADLPSGSQHRPFGMRYGVAPMEVGKHEKKPTQKSKKNQTAIYDDGQISGYEEDVEYYIEMDEE